MKSILVIDTPPCCNSCRLEHALICMATTRRLLINDLNCRPSWCPLKPMPEKKSIYQEIGLMTDVVNLTNVGWNACLEEIKG